MIIEKIINQQLIRARQTIQQLGLHNSLNKKNIIELGCGIGCLSRTLAYYGHSVTSFDDFSYETTEFGARYDKILDYFDHDRYHFKYATPHIQYVEDYNTQMFDFIRAQTNNRKADLILWQDCELWDNPDMGFEETLFLIKNLLQFLTNGGKIILGYTPRKKSHDILNFESTKSYQWLNKWRDTDLKQMGDYVWEIVNGEKHSNQSNWSRWLHGDRFRAYKPNSLNKHFFARADETTRYLGIGKTKTYPKNILEIGCGLGHLSKFLSQYHKVYSVDDLNFHDYDKNYQKYLKDVNWPRKHFYFRFPNKKFSKQNFQMFKTIESFGTKFDYILWQNSDLLDQPKLTLLCLRSLFENLTQYLEPKHGRFIIGFDCHIEQNYKRFRFYDFLKQWQIKSPSPMGNLTLSIKKQSY